MSDQNQKGKKIKKTDLGITLLILIGLLGVVNFFSYRLFFRWDLTQNKVFSISDASKRTVRELDDIVTIKTYFSSNLPSQVFSLKQEVSDILNEYAAYSNGRIKIEQIDPTGKSDVERELAILGIPQLTFEVYEKDKLQVVNGYMGLAVRYGDKVEVIPAIKRNTGDLEYQITTAIKKVTTDKIATIGYISGYGAPDWEKELKTARDSLAQLYSLVSVDLKGDKPEVPTNVDTLVVLGVKEEMGEPQFKAINAFLARGGALVVMVDGVTIGQGLFANKNQSRFETLLDKYGIKLGLDLVADVRSGIASFTQGFFTFSSNYPYWPKLTRDGFNQETSAVSSLENVILPWVSSVEVDQSKIAEPDFKYLGYTTDKAWRVADNFNVMPNATMVPQTGQKRYNLIALVNGQVSNPYPTGSEDEKMNARIVVVGDSEFMTDNFLRQSPDNLNLFLNLLDTVSFDEDLINIRSKGVSSRPISDSLSDTNKQLIRWLNIFGLTVVVLAFGLLRYYMRRRSKFIDEI